MNGPLHTARYSHTATLLTNGMVLVAGGIGAGNLSSAELYNPTTGIWTATGSMTNTRYGHTATLLPNGLVLVAGGFNGAYLSSAELYNPAVTVELGPQCRFTWNIARYGHTATLLPNGLVLVAGGIGQLVALPPLRNYTTLPRSSGRPPAH